MDYEEIFDKAFRNITTEYPCSDHETAFANVVERAEKMKKKDNTRVYDAKLYDAPVQSRKNRVLSAAAGAAAAVAVVGAGVLGIGYLNEHGGLREGGIESGGAANNGDVYMSAVQDTEYIDISELAGKTFRFSDMTATVECAAYDGQYIRLDVAEKWDGQPLISGFVLEPKRYDYVNADVSVSSIERECPDEHTYRLTMIREYALPLNGSAEFIPAQYGDHDTERINDLTVTISKDQERLILQPVYDEISNIGDNERLGKLDISPLLIEISVFCPEYTAFVPPEVLAIAADGTTTELTGVINSSFLSPEGSMEVRYYYLPDDIQIDLTAMKAFSINGKIFDVTEEPLHLEASTIVTADTTMTTPVQPEPETKEEYISMIVEDIIRLIEVNEDELSYVMQKRQVYEMIAAELRSQYETVNEDNDMDAEKRDELIRSILERIEGAELHIRYCEDEEQVLEDKINDLNEELKQYRDMEGNSAADYETTVPAQTDISDAD